MLYKVKENELKPVEFYNIQTLDDEIIGWTEKDLENLIADNMMEIYSEQVIMPIFQERSWQMEPDIVGINQNGDLIIFELKRGEVTRSAINQVMKYVEEWGMYNYDELNNNWKKYRGNNVVEDLIEAHATNFGLENSLKEHEFNRHQKMLVIGSSSDKSLIEGIEYWKSKGLDIDFVPYRFYIIDDEIYFEFFAKDYDYHANPITPRGIILNTNRTYNENDIWYMLNNNRASAFGGAAKVIDNINAGDYILFYHNGHGVIAVGKVKDKYTLRDESREESYKEVEFLTPLPKTENINELISVTPEELRSLLNRDFYFANTIITYNLNTDEVRTVADKLHDKIKNSSSVNY